MQFIRITINGIETEYKVSACGKVTNKRGNKLMSQHKNASGYLRVNLYVNNKYIFVLTHVLVAKAFIPNPENFEQVNHKDMDRSNNIVDNLEWVSRRENMLHSYKHPKRGKQGTSIIQCDLDGKILYQYRSLVDASRNFEGNHRTISNGIINCALGKTSIYKGYVWKYLTEQTVDKFPQDGRPIPGYEEYIAYPNGTIRSKKFDRFLKTVKDGYESVVLCVEGKRTTKNVHRLIAETFLPNPENKPVVNHKNGDKLDNRVENLEWATKSENSRHSFSCGLSKSRAVFQYNLDGKFIASFPSLREAQRSMGKSPDSTAILYACQGKSKTAYGYKWKYEV
jgi:hypothetical protein